MNTQALDIELYKSALTMPETLEMYGVHVNGRKLINCFVHPDDNASGAVYPDHYHCYGCGFHGDPIKVIEHFEKCSFIDALRTIARKKDLPEPRLSPESEQRYREAEDRSSYLEKVFADAQAHKDKALEYLKQRGITPEAIGEDLGLFLKSYTPPDREAAEKYGLISKSGRFLFGSYVVFPFRAGGRIQTIVGRFLGDCKPEYKHRKPSGQQTVCVWGQDEVDRKQPVYLCESPIKALSLKSNGFPNVVALAGVSFGEKHADLLKRRRVERVIVCFDTDSNGTGQAAALKAGELLFREGIETRIVTLPIPEGSAKIDLDEFFLSHSAEDFRKLPPRDFVSVRLDAIPTDGLPREKFRELEPILRLIAAEPELTWKEYGKAIAQRFPSLDERKIGKAICEHHDGTTEGRAKRDRFLPLEYVEKIRSEAPVITFDGRAYRYSGGVYAPWFSEEIDQRIIELYGPETEPKHLHAIREMLFSVAFVRPETVNRPGLLNLKNGLLRLESDEFIPHTPDVLSTVQAETSFEPAAECPLWIRTVAEVLPDPTSQQLLAQVFGACLVPSNAHQKGFIFWGDGANGKSVVTDVLEAVVGRENTAALHLTDFQERFRLAELQNRLINFSTEVEAKGLISDARIKSIVSGDPLTAERKNQQPFVFRPFCKLVISCNNLPQTTDRSYGYFRRWLLIPFTETFSGGKQDRGRARTIIETELSGVLNWAIGGYKSLREAGGFIDTKATAQALQDYKRQTDPVIDFTEERIRVSGGDTGTPLVEVYKAYNQWSLEFGYQPLGRNNFYRAIQRAVDRTQKRDREHGAVIPGVFLL